MKAVRSLLDRANSGAGIEVDGGIDVSNGGRLVVAGADIIVADSAIFGAPDPTVATHELKVAATAALLRGDL